MGGTILIKLKKPSWKSTAGFPVARQKLEFGVWRLEFGDWSLEFGVWSLEIGVWRLEFGRLEIGGMSLKLLRNDFFFQLGKFPDLKIIS